MNAPVIEKRFHDANPVATLNRELLAEAGVFAVSIRGGPGCGKTSLIESSINRLSPEVQVGVIACDIASHRDADRMTLGSDQVVQVNTGEQGASDATHIRDALRWLDLTKIDLLFIENVGTLVCTNPLDLGENVAATMFSVAGGHDKADKHPEIVRSAGIVILNKIDLLGSVPFDMEAFRSDVRRLNASVDLLELSALTGAGVDRWLEWLKTRLKKHAHRCRPGLDESPAGSLDRYRSAFMSTDSPTNYERILVAIDDSQPAKWAVCVGKQLARQLMARVMLVHVIEPVAAIGDDYLASQQIETIRRKHGEELLGKAGLLFPSTVGVQTALRSGLAADEITAAAREWNADLIVMGAHGRGRIAQLVLGSSADAVIRQAQCPVVAVAHQPRYLSATTGDWIGVGSDCAEPIAAHVHASE